MVPYLLGAEDRMNRKRGWNWNPWTDDVTRHLIALHNSTSLTTREMADFLNSRFKLELSRNAVLGKLHRLNLQGRL